MVNDMCIGNDVVDLLTVDHQKPDRYLRRIFSADEYKRYVSEGAASTLVWRAWAAKEAAFKMLRQAGVLNSFVPSRLTYCDRTSRIRYENSEWQVDIGQSTQMVSAVVSESPRWASVTGEISTLSKVKSDLFCDSELEAGCLDWPLESIAVRVLAKQYLSRHFKCAPSDIQLSAPDKYAQPYGSICARPFDRGLSFSHDGRFAAIAISEQLLR
jgi:phosphopantetheinyl transferase (holo-ACP synthase)